MRLPTRHHHRQHSRSRSSLSPVMTRLRSFIVGSVRTVLVITCLLIMVLATPMPSTSSSPMISVSQSHSSLSSTASISTRKDNDGIVENVKSGLSTAKCFLHWPTSAVSTSMRTTETYHLPNSLFGITRGGSDSKDSDHIDIEESSSSSSYTLGVRDSIMIAHSFHGHPKFGPAGGLHGATYTVDVEFVSSTVHEQLNWVIDIGVASDILKRCLSRYNYQNLDDVFNTISPESNHPTMTTTEFMCRQIHDDIWNELKKRQNDNDDEKEILFLGRIRVKLWESHKAWASYVGPSMSSSVM